MSKRILPGVVSLFCVLPALLARGTALDDYVAAPDDHYRYTVETMEKTGGPLDRHTLYNVMLYSQKWRTEAEVNRPVWEHWLSIAIPETLRTRMALLIVAGGAVGGSPPKLKEYTRVIVEATGAVVVLLQQVPNQPLIFADDGGRSRSEDDIIAYSYDKFLETGDPTWPALLPMTKSVVRAMDTVEEMAAERGIALDGFVVAGGSKRGWTTWLTAAVDRRVKAVVPIVIDVLQMDVQMAHHFMVYGAYSQSVQEYVDENIFDRFLTPRGRALLEIVDPYEYRRRFTLPKYIVNATGDEFFVLDSSRFYWDDLPEPKWLRYVPNSGHGIEANVETILSAVQFFKSVSMGEPVPRIHWEFPLDGSIRVSTDGGESQVLLWQATNSATRDFRWYRGQGPRWNSTPLQAEEPGTYVARVEKPPAGWSAFFVEVGYPSGIILSSEVRVTPDCLPYEDSDGDGLLNKDDPDDDNDGIPDVDDPFPCDADNDGMPDSFESAREVRRQAQAVPSPPPPDTGARPDRGGYLVLLGIMGGLILLGVLLLYVASRRT